MNKEILIPTSWQDVTLGEYIELSKLNISSYKSPVEYYIHMLRLFGNDDIESIFEYIKAVDLNSIVGQMDFMKEQPKQLDNKSIDVNGVKFYLAKNLNEITVGEYVSIEQMIETDKLDSVSAIPVILSVILRPLDEEFDSNLCAERIELFKNSLSIEDVLGMSVFFSIGVR